MILSSKTQTVERAQPWLGTLVSLRVEGLPMAAAHAAIDAAFAEVALLHRLMGFHDPQSDVSRLNCMPAGGVLRVHPSTYRVLGKAIEISASSNGVFDVTIGAELVAWGLLPAHGKRQGSPVGRVPGIAPNPRPASWRDVELLPRNRVRLHRPCLIDLGGIAKGFAVDRATEILLAAGAPKIVVNAGGDIRVHGEQAELIQLGAALQSNQTTLLQLQNGSVASSGGQAHPQGAKAPDEARGPHVHGITRMPSPADRFVCVLAEDCILADALTKVVMALGQASTPVLRRFNASACMLDPGGTWQSLGAQAA